MKNKTRKKIDVISQNKAYLGYVYDNNRLDDEGIVQKKNGDIIHIKYNTYYQKKLGSVITKKEAIKLLAEKDRLGLILNYNFADLKKYYFSNKKTLDKEFDIKWEQVLEKIQNK